MNFYTPNIFYTPNFKFLEITLMLMCFKGFGNLFGKPFLLHIVHDLNCKIKELN